MNKERYEELMYDEGLSLTEEEKLEGYHFCWDLNGLLIHKDDLEASRCNCNITEAQT